MLTPAYKVTVGKKVVDTTDEPKASTLVELRVDLDMDTPADRFAIVLGQVDGLHPAPGDTAAVELGYADDSGSLSQVIKGTVVTVEPGLVRNRVIGYTAAQALLHHFDNRSFENQTAGAIVRSLCQDASVAVDTVDDGITFPDYVIDGRRSFYRHIVDLASLCGFDVYVNTDGKLVFREFTTGRTVHVFEFKKDILDLVVTRAPAFATTVDAFGESPTGSQGENSWPWLTKDFSGDKGSAGSGAPLLLLERAALRTHDAAQAAADAARTRIRRRMLEGRVVTIGRPQVRLGDAIKLQSAPDAILNTNFQVRSVAHVITKSGGFTTTVGFRSLDTAAA